MLARHPEAGIEPDDVEQTGDPAGEEIPPERLEKAESSDEEPPTEGWIVAKDDSE